MQQLATDRGSGISTPGQLCAFHFIFHVLFHLGNGKENGNHRDYRDYIGVIWGFILGLYISGSEAAIK